MANAWLTEFTTLVPQPNVDIFPRFDVFRGGRKLVMHGEPKLTDYALDVSFKAQELAPGWSADLSGSGRVRPGLSGLVLATGSSPGSAAIETDEPLYETFELALTGLALTPARSQGSSVDVLAFEFRVDSTSYARIRVRRDPAADSNLLVVDTTIGLLDETLLGGGLFLLASEELDLRIIRCGAHLFLQANGQQAGATHRFLSSGFGVARVYAGNGSTSTKLTSIIYGMTVRSHGMVAGRLLVDKEDVSERRVVGYAPAATLAEVGARDIILFGPWGSTTYEGGFDYQLPEGRTLVSDASSSVVSYADAVVKD